MNLGVLLQGYSGMGDLGNLAPEGILPPSRSDLERETLALRANIVQLSRDFVNSNNTLTQSQLGRWNTFVADVKAWDWGPTFLAHVWDRPWRDELAVFQAKFNDFAAEFRAAGVGTSIPEFTFEEAPPGVLERLVDKGTAPFVDTAKAVKYAVIGTGAVAVAYLFYLTFETSRTARSLGPGLVRNPRRRRKRR